MPVDINGVIAYGVGQGTSAAGKVANKPPKGLEDLLTAYDRQVAPQLKVADDAAAKLEAEARALKAEAKKLKSPEKDNLLAQAKAKLDEAQKILDDAYGVAGYDVSRISGKDGVKLLLKAEGVGFDEADAGHAMAAAANATLWRVGYGYGTHRPMDAWLTDLPADGQLKLNVACTPSAHVGGSAAEQERNFDQYARTNRYVAEVWLRPAGASSPTQLLTSAHFAVKKPPEYVTLSPDLVVDLAKIKGDLVVKGWPEGSGGADGYIEARTTVIHLT